MGTDDGPIEQIGKSVGFFAKQYLPIPVQQMSKHGIGAAGPGALLGAAGLPLKPGELPPGAEEGVRAQLSNQAYLDGLREANEKMYRKLLRETKR